MNSATVEPPSDWKEARRLRAWELVQQGWKQKDVAAALGVTKGAVSQWVSQARQGDVAALRQRKHPGGRPKLNDGQRGQLPELLARRARGLWVQWGGVDPGSGRTGHRARVWGVL